MEHVCQQTSRIHMMAQQASGVVKLAFVWREKSGELQVRRLLRNLCRDFGLAIANPPGVPTHRAGSSIDLVLASRDLVIRNMVVHDGHSCACPTASCFPFLGGDHKLITFEVLLEPCGTEATAP